MCLQGSYIKYKGMLRVKKNEEKGAREGVLLLESEQKIDRNHIIIRLNLLRSSNVKYI